MQRRGMRQLHQDPAVVVTAVTDLGVLGQIGQDAAVLHAGLDLGVQRTLIEGLATACSRRSRPSPAYRH